MNIPAWLIESYLEAIPRLEARESIRAANVVAMGTGNLKKPDSQRIATQWKREANKGQGPGRSSLSPERAAKIGLGFIYE